MILSRRQPLADPPDLVESHRLGMAEMGYHGIAEHWLMRRLGDLHWRMIATAMGQAEAVFTCTQGKPLYAAFCVSRLHIPHPERARPGGTLGIEGRFYSIGRSRLASSCELTVDGAEFGRVELVSAFVGHEVPGQNASIVRRAPRAMSLPPAAPEGLQRLARRAAALAARGGPAAIRSLPSDAVHRLMPCPTLDFNAAGLLYFPSFAALVERADFLGGAAQTRQITARTTVYLGNVEPGDAVLVSLHPRRTGHFARLCAADGRALAFTASTYRGIGQGSGPGSEIAIR